MRLFWRIRYLDSRDKEFKDRDLWLDTETLDPIIRAAVEATEDMKKPGGGREWLKFQHYFTEDNPYDGDSTDTPFHGSISTVGPLDYFEDEDGNELTRNQMAVVLTGNPNAVMLPSGTKQYEIDFILAKQRPIQLDQISLSPEQLKCLGYFARDLRELLAAALFKDGPGRLTDCTGPNPRLQTQATDEEIRSFITIFRRLYMKKEPGNFVEAVAVFVDANNDNPIAGRINGIAREYLNGLDKSPRIIPMLGCQDLPFTRKQLIDVFMYTQYLHQPSKDRTRQFGEYLQAVGNRRELLTWIFLCDLWACSLHIGNAGRIIVDFYERYCDHHNVSASIISAASDECPGIGTLEKRQDRNDRVLRERTEELAQNLWENAGRPQAGLEAFRNKASVQLREVMGDNAE